MKYSAHSVSQKRQSRAQGEQCCIFIFPAVQEIFSFLRIKTLFSVLPRESYLTDVSSNKVLCSAFSVEQRYLKIRRFKSLDFTKFYLHHVIERRRKLFGSRSFSMNDAVVDVDVRIFSLKDASISNISSHHRWSTVDATLYDTIPIKLIFREKSIHYAEISCSVAVECNVKQQRSSSTMQHQHANLPYTNNCASDVISVNTLMDNAV